MAFWDGAAWVEVASRVTMMPDGSVRVDADVTHFTLYSVKYRGVRGYVAPAVYGSGTVGAVVFQPGGSFEELILATRREGAAAVWAQDDRGIYHLLIIDGPEFLKAEFYAAFPNGFPNFHAMTVVKQAGRNEASPEAPELAAPSAAPRSVAPAVQTATSNGSASAGTQRYTVSPTDTLSDIAVRFGVDWMAIANANGISGPNYFVRSGQVLTIPAGGKGSRTHTVSGTETLSEIGARYGVSWPQLAAVNNIAGPNYFVRPGQVLTIPNP